VRLSLAREARGEYYDDYVQRTTMCKGWDDSGYVQ